MRKVTYLSPADIEEIILCHGIKRPCEVSKKYKIGLNRLYKIWSTKPNLSAVSTGLTNAYKESRQREIKKRKNSKMN